VSLPQDVQAEAFEYPSRFFESECGPSLVNVVTVTCWFWLPNDSFSQKAAHVAGGGVIYSDATEQLARFAAQSRIPAGETQDGKVPCLSITRKIWAPSV